MGEWVNGWMVMKSYLDRGELVFCANQPNACRHGRSMGPLVAGQSLSYIDTCHCHWIVFAFCSPVLICNCLAYFTIIKKTKKLEDVVQAMKNFDDADDLSSSLLRDVNEDKSMTTG